jgi:Mn2+/Fe2+ NRAMP family transporter
LLPAGAFNLFKLMSYSTIIENNPGKPGWHYYLGPGLLYAGAAVGVSHLVQSTRAGAEYGWWPLWAIVFIHLAKYPFFKMGPQYAMRTGKSLIQGYFNLGGWAVALFLLFTFGTMWAIIAAVTSVTAGIASYIFGLSANAATVSAAIILLGAAILLVGKYRWLDKLMMYIMIVLTITTVAAFALALSKTPEVYAETLQPVLSGASLIMLVKLMGWMPAPLDLSVWHSIWALEKKKSTKGIFEYRRSIADFNLGYWGTMILGILFLGMGVYTLFGTGVVLPESGVAFSSVLLQMYTSQLGIWAFAIVAVAALATMFSTTLTCLDAIPRSLTETWNIATHSPAGNYRYAISLAVLAAGALALLTIWNPGMVAMVDLATVLSFVSTPAYAWLNLRATQHECASRGTSMKTIHLVWCYVSIALLTALAVGYFWVV